MARDNVMRNAFGNIVIYTLLKLSYDSARPFHMRWDRTDTNGNTHRPCLSPSQLERRPTNTFTISDLLAMANKSQFTLFRSDRLCDAVCVPYRSAVPSSPRVGHS